MKRIGSVDRTALGALALADIGAGIYIMSSHYATTLHVLVGVISILLAFPAGAAAFSGRLVRYSDEGVLVNVGVMFFTVLTLAFTPAPNAGRVVGMTIVLSAAAIATIGLYFRLFGVLRAPRVGRRLRDD